MAVVALILLALFAGCASPAYYGQAIGGHLSIMSKREDIEGILQRGDIDEKLRHDLELALEIRDYASEKLGLPDNNSYRQFVSTGRRAVTWNVIAAPEFSLEPERWCFLFAGCVPYRGYFDPAKAEQLAKKFDDEPLDVFISPAIAYSTLGWFDDPLLDTMLQYSDEQLAGLIFHELAHQQLYVKSDASFNESYASFVEEAGVRQWLTESGREQQLEHWNRQLKASARFNALLRQTRQNLQTEFSSGHPETTMRENKQSIYAAMDVQYRELVVAEWNGTDYFESWFEREVNNARLALVDSYHGGHCAFENLYDLAGRDIVRFQQMAAEKASLGSNQRTAWLNQPCERSGTDR